MHRQTDQTPDWQEISSDEAYKLSIAEFKGATIQALQDIRQDIKDMQQDNTVQRWISFGLGGLAGIITSVITNIKH